MLFVSSKMEHITPVLMKLHWLPISQRLNFKILLYVYKALHGLAPEYLTGMLQPYVTARALRSTHQGLLLEPRVRRQHYGGRAFAAAAPRLWNSLPTSVRAAETLDIFKSRLKAYLFRQAFAEIC